MLDLVLGSHQLLLQLLRTPDASISQLLVPAAVRTLVLCQREVVLKLLPALDADMACGLCLQPQSCWKHC